MHTLTSISRRGWSGRIARLPLSSGVFLFFFCFFCQGHRLHCTLSQIWTNEGSKRVVPLKEVPFWGLNDVPLNFEGKIPPKTEILGE